MSGLRAVVVEDAPAARRHLRRLLEEMPGVTWVGEATHGVEALAVCEELEPDVVFMDIELPGMSGLEVARRIGPTTRIIFTTAYDQHAVTAFELHAVDYLLKPFTPVRLADAVARVTELAPHSDPRPDRVSGPANPSGPLEKVYVRTRGRIVPVQLSHVELLESDGDYVLLWEGTRSHLVRIPLSQLMGQVSPDRFIRIHRSYAVNLDLATAFHSRHDGRIDVELRSGKRVVSSRGRTPELRQRLRL